VDLLEQLLGLPKAQLIFDLVAAVGAGDTRAALGQSDRIISNGMSIDTLVAALIDHLRNLMLIRACGAESDLVEVPGLSMADLSAQAALFDAAALSQDIVILEELRRHVRQSQAGRALLDATLVRMTLADQYSSLADLLNQATGGAAPAQKKKPDAAVTGGGERRTSKIERPTSNGEAAAPPAPAPAVERSTFDVGRSAFSSPPTFAPSAAPVVSAPPSLDDEDDDDLPAPGKVWDGGPKESLATLMARQKAAELASPPPEPSNVEPVGSADLDGQWQQLLRIVAEQGPSLTGLLQNGRFVGVEDGRAIVQLPSHNEMTLKLLEKGNKKEVVKAAFSQVLNAAVGVHFEMAPDDAPPPTTARAAAAPVSAPAHAVPARPPVPVSPPKMVAAVPAQAETANTIRLTDEIRNSLYQTDPLVKAIVDQFGGNVIKLEEA
jgi:DNA polymerase-3 subunit gamma/tau